MPTDEEMLIEQLTAEVFRLNAWNWWLESQVHHSIIFPDESTIIKLYKADIAAIGNSQPSNTQTDG